MKKSQNKPKISIVKEAHDQFKAFLKKHKLKHKLPFPYAEANKDNLKAGDNAFSMLQLMVKTANKDVPEGEYQYVPYFYNNGAGFCYSCSTWYHDFG